MMAKNKSPKKKQPPPRPADERVGAMHLCTKCQTQTVHWRTYDCRFVCSGCGKES